MLKKKQGFGKIQQMEVVHRMALSSMLILQGIDHVEEERAGGELVLGQVALEEEEVEELLTPVVVALVVAQAEEVVGDLLHHRAEGVVLDRVPGGSGAAQDAVALLLKPPGGSARFQTIEK